MQIVLNKISKYFLFIAIVLMASACGGNKIIPKEDLINIMSDMYTADALNEHLSANSIYRTSRDSMAIYKPILKKYGYTPDDFITSIEKYTERPTELKDIYTAVIVKLGEQEKKYTELAIIEKKERNCWVEADSVNIDTDSLYNSMDFDIELRGLGRYQIDAKYKFGDGDSTKNPRITAWFTSASNPDSVIAKQSFIISKTNVGIQSLYMYLSDTSYTRLKGQLISFDTIKAQWKQQVVISEINIDYAKEEIDNLNKRIDLLSR